MKKEKSSEDLEDSMYHTPKTTPKTAISKSLPKVEDDVFLDARRKIGLWSVECKHITMWREDGDKLTEKDIKDMFREREEAALEFLNKELKWKDKKLVNIK